MATVISSTGVVGDANREHLSYPLGITVEELVSSYPRLFHMAAVGSWPSIRSHGLLSTSELLTLFEVPGSLRYALESCHRPTSVTISHPDFGSAVVRDQIPMTDAGLRRALTSGMSPSDWYLTLNKRVFFWLTEERLERLLAAAAYRNASHCVLTLDTRRLVVDYLNQVTLSPINSGCTKPFPHPRGPDTFRTLERYPFQERQKLRRADAIVELAVTGGVLNIQKYVLEVRKRRAGIEGSIIWSRGQD